MPQYAKDQAEGFKNRIERVAVVGATGQVGTHITEQLLNENLKVTAITREGANHTFPAGVQVAPINYDDPAIIVAALKGHDALVITMAPNAPRDTSAKLIQAAADANIPYVLPNGWGYPYDESNSQFAKEILVSEPIFKDRKQIQELGKSAWISVCCGFWYEFSLSSPFRFGIDFQNKAVTFYDDGNTKISVSTWPQTGRAVAKLLSLKVLPEDENDHSPTISQFKNDFVCIDSYAISQQDMFDSTLRVTGDKKEDWKITHQPVQERYNKAIEGLSKGFNPIDFGTALYARVFYPGSKTDFQASRGTHNAILGLPKENLDESTKLAIKMSGEERKY